MVSNVIVNLVTGAALGFFLAAAIIFLPSIVSDIKRGLIESKNRRWWANQNLESTKRYHREVEIYKFLDTISGEFMGIRDKNGNLSNYILIEKWEQSKDGDLSWQLRGKNLSEES